MKCHQFAQTTTTPVTSLPLAEQLLVAAQNTLGIGTLRSNRAGFPKEVCNARLQKGRVVLLAVIAQEWLCWSGMTIVMFCFCPLNTLIKWWKLEGEIGRVKTLQGETEKVRNWYKKAQLSLTNPRDAKACQNCSNSTCLQRCRWQYWPIFIRLAAVSSEIPRNSLKIQTYEVQGHPRSSILVPIESPYVTCY